MKQNAKLRKTILEDYIRWFSQIDVGNVESAHTKADELLIEALDALGMKELADAWRDTEKRAYRKSKEIKNETCSESS